MAIRSKVLYTEEMDDAADAAEELFEQAEGFEFQKNTVGILFANKEVEYEELYAELSAKWSFPIAGATAIGMFAGKEGYRKSGISLMLCTSDDCSFAVGMTEQFGPDNYAEEIAKTYRELAARLPEGEKEKLILTYLGKVGAVGDDVIRVIEEAGSEALIYGGLASDEFVFQDFRVYCNGREEMQAQVMVLISGDISPKYNCVTSISDKTKFSYEVTKAEGNQVFELEGTSFIDVLRKADLEADKDQVIADFVLSPFVATLKKKGASVEVSRNLTFLNHENGAGIFLGGVPEGSSLEIGLLNRSDIHDSVKNSFAEFMAGVDDDGVERNTVICTSCAARYLAVGGGINGSNGNFWESIPDGKELVGMYSFGEFAPVDADDVKGVNLFHNSTFTVLTF